MRSKIGDKFKLDDNENFITDTWTIVGIEKLNNKDDCYQIKTYGYPVWNRYDIEHIDKLVDAFNPLFDEDWLE